MTRQEQLLFKAAQSVNWVAAAAIVAMMFLVSADVLLRFFRSPIPGAHDIVGFLATLAISLSLSYTTVTKSHIAVDFLVGKLPRRVQLYIDGINSLAGLVLFSLVTWQSASYGFYLRKVGETSQTLQVPVYPLAFGIAVGCGFLCCILAFQSYAAIRRVVRS